MRQRKFIFLEAIDIGYSISSNKLKGHVQFDESKDKIAVSLFIEGLNHDEYGVDILHGENICTNIGNFYGNSRIETKFYTSNSINNIRAILIYPMSDKNKIVLIGYLIDKSKLNINEISYMRGINNNNLENNEKKIINEISDDLKTISKKVEEDNNNIEKNIILEEDINISTNIEDNIFDQMDEGFMSENKTIDNEDELQKKENLIKNSNSQSNSKESESNSSPKGGMYNNKIFYLWQNIDKLDECLKKANPFMQSIPKHKWWYVKEYDTEIQYYSILYNGYMMPMVYPYMNYKNIGNIDNEWIFGAVTDDYEGKEVLKYFVYGIPGKFYMQDQPFRGSTGYLYWQSKDVIKRDPQGYWLLYVDVHTGKIVIPRRPVKPPLNKNIMHNNM
ncbi:hypothetical protein GC105_15940 [Alkalibaculum sp. M08DMB]|uniref:Uncharacterized protein n=1 Tax=Alkalibaculum sporogenes TaxID=2655001 RepID=A0A6A7KCL5_9FIRM|nr:hypothetical protein [Alkalibaculum sporogenes]MPW27258.1 hypothetical protein [Alkalibaculum sporogenes]